MRLSKARKLILGVVVLLCVDLLWFSSSEVSHFIYTSDDYNKPYFTTYIKTAMFSLYLLGFLFWRPWHRRLFNEFGNYSNGSSNTSTEVLGIVETIKLSCTFSILWFVGGLSYSEALAIAQPAIVNTLSSISAVFTCILAAFFPFDESDSFTISKFLLSVISVVGVGFIADSTDSSHDAHQNFTSLSTTDDPQHFSFYDQFLGITWSLVGAAAYAIYLTLARYKVGENRSLDIPMFFGFVGFFNTILLWPGLILFNFTKWEPFELPHDTSVWLLIFFNGLFGTVVSELLWLWGCFLTSSLLGTLSLSLSNIFTMVFDTVFRDKHYSWQFYLGSVLLTFSFVTVSLLQHKNIDPVGNLLCSLCPKKYHRTNEEDQEHLLA